MPNPPPSPSSEQHNCVLCNAKLPSKEELQDHFRKHANKEIDAKGRPKKMMTFGYSRPSKPVAAKAANDASTSKTESFAVASTVELPSELVTASTSKSKVSSKKLAQPIACDVCSQEFDTVTMAIQHKFRKHPNSSIKHYCPYCGMQFPLKINRDMHLSTHPEPRGTDSFPCNECGVVFHTPHALNYHYKSTHKRIVALFKPVVTPPPSKKIRLNNAGEAQSVFYCHLCGYEYIVKFNLQKHLERQHSDDDRDGLPKDLIKCTTCDALFYNKKAYENHNMYHKPDDLYVTSEEQRLQTVTRVDQDFDIRRVQTTVDKFIPIYKPRPVLDLKNTSFESKSKRKIQKETEISSDSELSPDSSSMSDSDSSDCESAAKKKMPVKQSPKKKMKREADAINHVVMNE